ncbi:MAG: methionine biosynthesis protein MetW [Coriobacteriia bacterium]|nr:methionine biosynthesis protein MetW [Coriobacteriia bacterium]
MTAAERLRRDLALVAGIVPPGARVLDLGCGDGALLEAVRETRGAVVRGVELDLAGVGACVARGVSVVQADIDAGLAGFPDGAFDLVVLSQTLQVVRNPALVLREMLRVGERGIISFPNFGNWRVRGYLGLRGRMPVSSSLPYEWYETPNIHLTTVKDFRVFCARNGVRIEREIPLAEDAGLPGALVRIAPNLLAETSIAVVARA